MNGLLTLLAKSGASTKDSVITNDAARLEGTIASAMIRNIQQQVPGLTSGMGTMESSFDHYAPVIGPQRSRRRSGADPFNRTEYLLRMRRNLVGTNPAGEKGD